MKTLKKILIFIVIVVIGIFYSYGTWSKEIFDTSIGSMSYEKTDFLTSGSVLEQEFECDRQGLSGFTLKLLKQEGQQLGNYDWIIQETESGKVIAKGEIGEAETETRLFQSSNPQKQGTIRVKFPCQKDSKEKKYKLVLKATDIQDVESAAVYLTNSNSVVSSLKVNGQTISGKASVLKLDCKRFNAETFVVFLGIAAYLWVFIKFMYKLFK